MNPVLIACSHGTSNPDGTAAIDALRAEIESLRPGLDVREAYVDVQEPALPDVVAALSEGTEAVVVPLLLSVGYHVKVDVARAVAKRAELAAAGALGPDPRLAALLQQRLEEAGLADDDGVVLAAAGSSDPSAASDVEAVAEHLRALRSGTVVVGYGASAQPTVPDAVAALRREPGGRETGGDIDGGARVAVASYLLAPGYFHDQLAKAGADVVTAPLLPSRHIADIALERYDAAVRTLREGLPAQP